jgi:non-specific serine/threonine protein kinase
VDKSLLRHSEAEGEPRFWMLWTIREYGLERLAENGEADAVKERHAHYYMQMVEQAAPHLTGGARSEWLATLAAEAENLRAALAWGLQAGSGDPEVGLRIAGALHWFWYFQGNLTEGRNWLEKALALTGPLRHTAAGARAINAAGKLAYLQGDYEVVIPRLEESVTIWRDLGDREGLAYALADYGISIISRTREAGSGGTQFLEEAVSLFRETGNRWGLAYALDLMGDAATWLGQPEQETAAYKAQSLALFREIGDKWGIISELSELGMTALRLGDFETASTMLEEALPMQQTMGDPWVTAHVVRCLGDVAWHRGDYTRAETLYEESLAAFGKLGDRLRQAASLRSLGHVAFDRADLERAAELYLESLDIVYAFRSEQNIPLCMAALAGLCRAQGRPERAATLFGVADAMREKSHAIVPSIDRIEYERNLAAVRKVISEKAFDEAWEQGRQMSLDQAVAYANEVFPTGK